MGTPYEREFRFQTEAANEIVALPFPGRCTLKKLAVVREGTGAIDLNVYSRAFTSDPADVVRVEDDGDGNTLIRTVTPFLVKAGDVVDVSDTSVAGYNTDHRVLRVLDNHRFVTDQTFTDPATGGEVQLDIPEAEHPLYQVTDNKTGADSLVELGLDRIFVNQDPQGQHGTGVVRRIYLQMANDATYRVVLSADMDVAGEG